MTERPSFLPPAEFVQLAPEPTGFAAALGKARRRRRRQVGEVGVAFGLAVAVLAGLQMPTRDLGQDRVGVTDAADTRTTEDLKIDDAAPIAPETRPSQAPGTTQTATRRTPSSPRAGAVAAASPAMPASTPQRPRGDTPVGPAYKNELKRTQTTPIGGTCVNGDWCLYARATQVNGGNRYTLAVDVCRAIDASSTTIDFSDAHEVEFVVHDSTEDLWTWSRGQRFAADPETVTFDAGTCYTWSTDYTKTVDDQGYFLDPGTYTLRAWSTGAGLGASRAATTQLTVG